MGRIPLLGGVGVNVVDLSLSSANGAHWESPGQRPGKPIRPYFAALKGHMRHSDNAPFQGFRHPDMSCPQGVALGSPNVPFQGDNVLSQQYWGQRWVVFPSWEG